MDENGFHVTHDYVINGSPRVDSLPFALVSDWLSALNGESKPLVDFNSFRDFFFNTNTQQLDNNEHEVPDEEHQVPDIHYQRLMFAYYNNLQQWDISFQDLDTKIKSGNARELRPSGRATTMASGVQRPGKRNNEYSDDVGMIKNDRRRAFTVGNKRNLDDSKKRASYSGRKEVAFVLF